MFNRSTKMTALLVAAASVLTTVPAFAADSVRLDNKEGNITKAAAYKNGAYLYEGYKSDDDEEGLYYNSGEKDSKDKYLEDADEFESKFGDKFVKVTDNGDDEYVVDLSTGKITDEDTLDELTSTAKNKLENKLAKASRYDNDNDAGTFKPLEDNYYDGMWYSYENTTGFGYTNASGSYIDCSYDLNAYVYYDATTSADRTEGKMFKLENLGDTTEVGKDADKNKLYVKATNVELVQTLAQDEKNIYSLIKVTVEVPDRDAKDNAIKHESTTEPAKTEDHFYVQKVSKAQGDKEDGAYKPKTTECYEVTSNLYFDDKSALDNEDIRKAYTALSKVGTKIDDKDVVTRVVDGAIYVTYTSEDKVKTEKIVLKNSEKIDLKDTTDNKKFDKVSGHVALLDDDKDHDAKDWSVDVNGTVWAIYKGDIMKSTKLGDFDTVYTCDRTLNRIDVYDESNLIAWDSEGDVYTTVTEGKEVTPEPVPDPTPVVTEGWQSDAAGNWSFVKNGAKVTGWYRDGATWYYMDAAGTMQTGWVSVNGAWYYLNPVSDGTKGAMKTGWLYDTNYGAWFYLQPSTGAMATGWYQDTTGTWYYSYSNGKMAANTTIGGYKLGASGAWIR